MISFSSIIKREKNVYPVVLFGLILCFVIVCVGYFAFSVVSDEDLARLRNKMVAWQIKARGVKDEKVIQAMLKVERHRFVPPAYRSQAYDDHPLPIGENQTISQPYIVALMTELLKPSENDIVLEIGTGSGYQAAVLAEIVKEVYTIEIVESLGKKSKELLQELGYKNVFVRIGDGYKGWPEKQPFDKIIVTAAPDHVPQPLIDQLKPGGRMVIPVGSYYQSLLLITKDQDGKIDKRETIGVRFVPMTGEAEKK